MIMPQSLLGKERDNEGNENVCWHVYIDINVCTSVTMEMKRFRAEPFEHHRVLREILLRSE